MKQLIKILIALLLSGCFLKMPYGYYQFVRWAVSISFIWFAYNEYKNNKKALTVLCSVIAILFNPIAPIYFSKETWHPIDAAIAIFLIIWAVVDLIKYKKQIVVLPP